MDNEQNTLQQAPAVVEQPIAPPQNEHLKPYLESVTKAISEKIQPFGEKMNPKVLEMSTKDRSQEKDYKIEVIDNPWSEGIVHVQESWDGGQRSMRIFDDRYKPTSEYDNQPGEFSMGFTEGKSDYDKWGASMRFDTRYGSLSQEITCTTEKATRSMYGQGALLTGEFFKWAGSGQMTEKTYIEKDGKTSYKRSWSEEGKWLGGRPERYQTTRVDDVNGLVRKGSLVHGIALGVSVNMEVVFNPNRK